MSDTLLAALIAALAAFLAALFTVVGTYGIDRYKKFLDTKQQKLSILSTLTAELSSLKYLIEDRKKGFETTTKTFPPTTLPYIPISYNYFSVFDNLAAEVGLINAPETNTLIISTYTEIKGLFENVKDLGNKAQILQSLSITPGVNQDTIKAITENLLKMQGFVLFEQVPKVLQLITTCIKAIDDEKEKIQKESWLLKL